MKKSLFLFLICCCIFSSCKVYRFFVRNFANITDYKFFTEHSISHSTEPFYFFYSNKINAPGNLRVKGFDGDSATLDNVLEQSPSVAFLIIRRDTILYEKYWDKYTDSSWVASFSMAKSFTSALIGIAIHEGFIKSVDEPITNYIPEIKDTAFKKVKIEHLLQMTSGIKFTERYYNPFSDAAKFYYGTNLRSAIENMKIEYVPGTKFEYKSGNPQLLGLIIERATKKTVTEYLQEKIWQPIGAEFDASWSTDRKNNGLEKTFCCLNAAARDYAKFGRLYLKDGNWNGVRVVPQEWVKESTTPTLTEGGVNFYKYQWWINRSSTHDFSCDGLLGQRIFVYPEKQIIIVRLGKNDRNQNYFKLFGQLIHLL
ncbi:hypothetical protein LBMAG27_16320 [Bacteroidota bacterium]|nr:hypothetical protein LBMAG27_16320 [Bacteroidota bacterium]